MINPLTVLLWGLWIMNGNDCRKAEEVNDSNCLSPLVPEFSCCSAAGQPQHEALRQTKIREQEYYQLFQTTPDVHMVVFIVLHKIFHVFLQTTSWKYLYKMQIPHLYFIRSILLQLLSNLKHNLETGLFGALDYEKMSCVSFSSWFFKLS